ncbi:hypothetical protein F2Q70_00017740 [Brassica cretica]|uniref:Uncharacterized protein n=1 Tax=Brassica cretica TaxID=69181 RepID=A0A8S9I370_BRACR|nr:hypothetical protein F2Q70_00017740 [Brassica cretica]
MEVTGEVDFRLLVGFAIPPRLQALPTASDSVSALEPGTTSPDTLPCNVGKGSADRPKEVVPLLILEDENYKTSATLVHEDTLN